MAGRALTGRENQLPVHRVTNTLELRIALRKLRAGCAYIPAGRNRGAAAQNGDESHFPDRSRGNIHSPGSRSSRL
ncbi:hypothetical protein D3C73_1598240 [compost metagenome]